jgi:hypothetical protein
MSVHEPFPPASRRLWRALAAGVALTCALLAVPAAGAAAPVLVTGTPSPFAACTADDPAAQPPTLFENSEVEPSVDVNPLDPANIVGFWQQDRWSTIGGARGLVAGVSHDGGASWTQVPMPGITKCTGGPWDRASDPWVSFGPDGRLYAVSLTFNAFDFDQGVVANTSTDGGLTWSAPSVLIHDTAATVIDDKQSITADPTRPGYAYAVWDRIQYPGGKHGHDEGEEGGENAVPAAASESPSHGPTWLARTTDGGATWEPARKIFRAGPGGQTIGNVIVVLPDGTLIDGFTWFPPGHGHLRAAVIRSTDAGLHWSRPTVIAREVPAGVDDPDTGQPLRTGDILPSFAVDPTSGTLYAVWEDARFSGRTTEAVAFSMSTDGGLSWTHPIVKINRTPTDIPEADQQAFLPTVHVAPDGTVGVLYDDFRSNVPGGGATTDVWLLQCRISCSQGPGSWTESHVAGPFDYEQAPSAGGLFLGDYQGLTFTGGAFAAFFGEGVSRAAGDPSDMFFATIPLTP